MDKTEQKSIQVALTKAVVEGEKWVRAVVSATTLDRDHDIVDNASLRLPLKNNKGTVKAKSLTGNEELDIPFLVDHNFSVENVIGSARSAKMNAQGELEMVFGLSSVDKAQKMYTLLKEGHLNNAFSITFHDYDLNNGVMYDAEVLEVSLVWRGSNPDARLLEVSKMLTVEKEVEAEEVETKEENTTESQEEVEETETKEVVEETTTETETQNAEAVKTETTKEESVETVEENNKEKAESEDVAADTDESEDEDKENNKEKQQMENKEVAIENVTEKAVAEQAKKVTKVANSVVRKNFVEQLGAIYHKDEASLIRAASKGMELAGLESKVLDGSSIYLDEVVADDIVRAYVDAGGVGALVTKIDITGADIFKKVVETSGTGFQATALGAAKSEDQPVWSEKQIIPYEWALIVVWLDGVAARTPIAVYNEIVRYIADQYKKLEDKIVLTYAGGTVGSETRAATGLVPQLATASRVAPFAGYDSEFLYPALAEAFGEIESDGQLTVVANRTTWAQLAVSTDANFNTVFKVAGKELSAGALGTFRVVTSEALADGDIVVGNFADYTLVTRGSLATLFSQEATVGSTNLFTQNASALRASVDIAGAATPVTSFYLLRETVVS